MDPEVFQTTVTLDAARCALAALLLIEFKTLEHPIRIPSPTLIPSILHAFRLVQKDVPELLGITEKAVDDIIGN